MLAHVLTQMLVIHVIKICMYTLKCLPMYSLKCLSYTS